MNEPFRILTVCSANICRSPAAEWYLRHHAEQQGFAIEVSSSGFLFDGEPASDAMSEVMGERGFDLSTHRSRISTCEMVDAADLVVTMERRHARDLSASCGPRRIFTLKAAVAALREVDPAIIDPRARVAAADEARRPGDLLGGGDDEVDDPFGKSMRINRRTADLIGQLTEELLDTLFSTTEAPS